MKFCLFRDAFSNDTNGFFWAKRIKKKKKHIGGLLCVQKSDSLKTNSEPIRCRSQNISNVFYFFVPVIFTALFPNSFSPSLFFPPQVWIQVNWSKGSSEQHKASQLDWVLNEFRGKQTGSVRLSDSKLHWVLALKVLLFVYCRLLVRLMYTKKALNGR